MSPLVLYLLKSLQAYYKGSMLQRIGLSSLHWSSVLLRFAWPGRKNAITEVLFLTNSILNFRLPGTFRHMNKSVNWHFYRLINKMSLHIFRTNKVLHNHGLLYMTKIKALKSSSTSSDLRIYINKQNLPLNISFGLNIKRILCIKWNYLDFLKMFNIKMIV